MSRSALLFFAGIAVLSIGLSGSAAWADPPKGATTEKPSEPAAPHRPADKPSRKAPLAPADEGVQSLFDRGVRAVDQGQLTLAEELFSKALAERSTWDIATNLGVVERKLHHDVAAAEHLRLALRAFPPSETEETRRSIERELSLVLPAVVQIKLHSNVAGAEVRLGGATKGTLPLPDPLFAAPGSIAVEVTKEGFAPETRTVRGVAGATIDVTVQLTKRGSAVAPRWVAPAVAFGFGGLGLLTGVVAGAFAAGRMADLKATCRGGVLCPESARAAADEGRTAAHLSTTGFVLAGLGAAVGTGLFLFSIPGAPASARLTTGLTSVLVEGSF